jgi:hypothetical protein
MLKAAEMKMKNEETQYDALENGNHKSVCEIELKKQHFIY